MSTTITILESGDIATATISTAVAVIGANAITNALLAQMPTHTFKGNNTSATANALDLTATQLTAELNAFSSTLKGLVPLSGGGTTNFLRADGTWAVAGTGTITALTGDGTASGTGSVALTLATVNSNVGSFGSASSSLSATVNAKGLVTAISAQSIAIAQSQVTGLVAALALLAPISAPTFTGNVTGTFVGNLTGNVTGNTSGSAGSFTGSLVGDVTGTQGATAIAAATVTGKALTGYVSGAGTISAADSVLTAINKLNGNIAALGSGSGTVTSVSVVSANGLAGTVANATTTPAITLSTTITGFLQGNGTAISAATTTGSGSTLVLATSPTLVTPLLGTPTSGVLTNCTGTAASLTAGNVTTNANLTGPITSSGNATSVAAQTGTGTTFVMQASPVLTTPNIGTPSAGVLTNCSGTAASLTAGNVTTNANLTGDVTSVGNATTLTNAPVIAKVLTGYTSGAGTVAATDSILQAIQKLNGNDATNANLTGPITSSGNATSVAAQTGTGTTFVMQTSPTLTTPLLGTPTSGVLTNCTGTASGLTAGNVTTNANLTGPITSSGNATSIAAQTGTGTTFVMQTSPVLTTPNIGTPSAGVLTNCSGTAASLTAGNVTTNANLTGVITSVGNATSIASQTGTGTKFVVDTSPTLVTPALGTPTALVGTNITGTATSFTASNVTTNANLTGPITSSGNATSVAAQTGTGSVFVMQASPTLTTPNLGTPSALVGTNISGTAASLTAGNVTTNANLTGVITSSGNATSIASQTGTGTKFVVDTSPTLVTPVLGVASGTSLSLSGLTASQVVVTDGSKNLASLAYATAATASTLAEWDASANLSANSMIQGYTTTATAAGTTTLTVASPQQQYFTGSTTQNCKLPVTSTLVLGQSFTIVNNSSGAVTIQSSGANTIATVAAGSSSTCVVILTSGTTAASWSAASAGGGGISALTGDVTASGTGSVAATIAANAVTNAKLAQGGAYTVKGNLTSGTANLTDNQTIILGTPNFTPGALLEQITGTSTTFLQSIRNNLSAGVSASTDFVVENDLGTDTTYYGDFGINSSGFTGTGSFSLPNATYLCSATGDLVLGSFTSNAIRFVINNGATDALQISTAGAINIPGLTASTALALDSSKNIVSVTNSGTGNNAMTTSPVFTTPNLGTPSTLVATNASGTAASLTAGSCTTIPSLSGEVTSSGNSTTVTNASVIAKVLTGYSSGAGVLSSADSILTAIQKLNGNIAGLGGVAGDIGVTSFSAANNISSPADVTGLVFSNAVVRSFEALVSVYVDATSDLFETFKMYGIQRGADWQMAQVGAGDDSGFVFTITTAGQIQYVNSNYSGFSTATVKFRAMTLAV